MKADLLQERLLGRGKAQQLGHFYLFSGAPRDLVQQKEWTKKFIRRYWSEIEGRKVIPQDILSDADLLWISPPLNDDDETVDYKVDGVEGALSKFLPYRGLASQRRFVVFEEAHRLSTTISNKLLKTLEEPEGQISFLFLNPMGKKVLPTIESRAIHLKLTWPETPKPIGDQLAGVKTRFETSEYPLAQFLEEGKKGIYSPEELLEEMMIYEQHFEGTAGYQQELLTQIREWDEAERFNQPIGPRLQGLYHLLSQRFRSGR